MYSISLAKLINLSFFLVVFLVTGCSTAQVSKIPGIENSIKHPYDEESIDVKPIPITTVLKALKIQLAEAILSLEAIRMENKDHPIIEELILRTGNGTLSGESQLVQTDNGNILAVIPFTGFAGSTLTPNLGIDEAATSKQNIALNFSFTPKITCDRTLSREEEEKKGIDVGTFIRDALVASFNQIAEMPYDRSVRRAYEPIFSNRELKLSLLFSVVRTGQAGLGVKIVPASPNIDEVTSGPIFGTKKQQTGTYSLELTVPLVTANPNDGKRILVGSLDLQSLENIDKTKNYIKKVEESDRNDKKAIIDKLKNELTDSLKKNSIILADLPYDEDIARKAGLISPRDKDDDPCAYNNIDESSPDSIQFKTILESFDNVPINEIELNDLPDRKSKGENQQELFYLESEPSF
jgi:hypothetical protein